MKLRAQKYDVVSDTGVQLDVKLNLNKDLKTSITVPKIKNVMKSTLNERGFPSINATARGKSKDAKKSKKQKGSLIKNYMKPTNRYNSIKQKFDPDDLDKVPFEHKVYRPHQSNLKRQNAIRTSSPGNRRRSRGSDDSDQEFKIEEEMQSLLQRCSNIDEGSVYGGFASSMA